MKRWSIKHEEDKHPQNRRESWKFKQMIICKKYNRLEYTIKRLMENRTKQIKKLGGIREDQSRKSNIQLISSPEKKKSEHRKEIKKNIKRIIWKIFQNWKTWVDLNPWDNEFKKDIYRTHLIKLQKPGI